MIVPRWEWRTFGDDFGEAERKLAAIAPERVHESDEIYLLSVASDASVKVRDGLMDVKLLEAVDGDGLEQWRPALKAEFPLAAAGVLAREAYAADQLVGELIDPDPRVRALEVHKHRERFTVGGAMAELSEARVAEGARRTIAIESEDASLVVAAVRELGLPLRPNVCLARGLKALVGFAA